MANRWKTILVLAVVFNCHFTQVRAELELIDNKYEGLVVKISDKIPQDHCNGVIHGLKVVLSRLSSLLWEVTEGRAFLGEVTISLPKAWRTNAPTCSLLQPLKAAALTLKSHINVRTAHPLYGVEPWTQQSQGCGKHGDFIQIGADILRATTNESHSRTAHKLLKQWTRFRWGLFDDSGEEGDPLYPPFYYDPVLKTRKRNKCSGNPRLPYCDNENHVREAPTKQNVLCSGKAPWNIIQTSEDFNNNKSHATNSSRLSSPSYRFVQDRAARIILAVEDTAVMNLQRRWEFVRKAVRRAVVYDVPDGAHMGLVVFNSVAKTVAPLSRIDSLSDVRQRIGSSLPRNPSTVPESHKCVMCGIQEALRALGPDAAGANIILVTTGSGIAAHKHQTEEIRRLLRSSEVQVTPVIYPLTETLGNSPSATSTFEGLVGVDAGRLFTVIDEGVGNDSKVSMMVALMDALLASVRLSSPQSTSEAPMIVHSAAFPGGISSVSAGSFHLDASLGSSARFSVYYYDLNHVGNAIRLTTPSGSVMASVNMQEEDGDANVIFVNIPEAERGVWRYNVENRADSHQGLHIQVTAHENPTRNLKIQLRTGSNSLNQTILFAELKEDDLPILGAQVQARLRPLGTNETGYPFKSFYINLTDNGVGDPDITKSDGVYSRYIPQMHVPAGQYELSVIVDHNEGLAMTPTVNSFARQSTLHGHRLVETCCGNELNYDHLRPVKPFWREISHGIFTLHAPVTSADNVPPSRILDLRTTVYNSSEVALTWTAPGDDHDWGRAEAYEATISTSFQETETFSGKLLQKLPFPHRSGLEQSFRFNVSIYDEVVYVSLRAIDASGNKGGVGNIVTLVVPHPPTTRAPQTTPSVDAPTNYLAENYDQSSKLHVENFEIIAMVAGSIMVLLVMLAAILCFCYISVKNRKQKKKDREMNSNPSVMIKTKSSPVASRREVHESSDSLEKNDDAFKEVRSLSPVQSWAASRLLVEHERRYSFNKDQAYGQQDPAANYPGNGQQGGPYPDVTLNCSQSYPNSQTPSTTNSDPPAYQQSYGGEVYPPYPYGPHHQSFNSEELPPYSQGLPSQSSQGSVAYPPEAPMLHPSDLLYTQDGVEVYDPQMLAYVIGDASYANIPQVHYQCDPNIVGYPEDNKKVPPPVAPKPHSNVSLADQKRRNITQV